MVVFLRSGICVYIFVYCFLFVWVGAVRGGGWSFSVDDIIFCFNGYLEGDLYFLSFRF